MTISDLIRMMIDSKDITLTAFAQKIGMSRQALNGRLRENTWQLSDVAKYADALEYDIKIVAIDRLSKQTMAMDIMADK